MDKKQLKGHVKKNRDQIRLLSIMPPHIPSFLKLGDRIQVDENIATIRYIGPVDQTDGEWLGIEWDDASRGKHNGEKDGKSYFSCR